MKFPKILFSLTLLFLTAVLLPAAPTVRIKDIAYLMGVRNNQLLGMGLVTGLSGKGDSQNSGLLRIVMANLLSNFDLTIDPAEVRSKNCAVVMVSAEIPPFLRPGDTVDLHVSSIGDAKSLEGGILLQTSLKAANGKVYAAAQGKIITSSDRDSTKTAGTITGGATMEREVQSSFVENNTVKIVLRNPDFVTANSLGEAVKKAFTDITVKPVDAALVEISVPQTEQADIVSFIARLESLPITPDVSGKVVIDPEADIIIIGENVRIGKVAVSYKQLNVDTGTAFTDEKGTPANFLFNETTSVEDLVNLFREVGLKAEVITGILQAIEKAGALYGTLIIM